MLRTGKLYKLVHLLISLALFAGLALTPTQPAYAATIFVNSLDDPGGGICNKDNCTLREAIDDANDSPGADTIRFKVSGTITLTSSLPGILMVGGGLTIDGSGQTIHINGNDNYRVLSTQSHANLTLKNLIIEEGYTTVYGSGGAGVYSLGPLTVDSCTFSNNVASDYGGAIYSNGTLTITNSSFSYNDTQFLNGGAIYVYTGTVVTVSDSGFNNNRAGLNGGAIFNNGDLEIKDTTFLLNSTSSGSGGAIFNRGDLDIQAVTFAANDAALDGGALFTEGGSNVFHIVDSAFNYNIASRHGGAAYIKNALDDSFIRSCTFDQNTAYSDGGGLYNLADFKIYTSVFKHNDAKRDGGGIYNGDTLFIADATIESNTSDQNGGGVYNNEFSEIDIRNTTFSGNQATNYGGALFHRTDADQSSLTNDTFYNNSALWGGGIYSGGGLRVYNSTLSNNSATRGGAVFGNSITDFYNSILANSPSGENCDTDGSLPDNGGNNIDSGLNCAWGYLNGSKSGRDPLLGPLQFNGGWTKTMALLSDSPAVDAVRWNAPNNCPTGDQRNYPRPFGTYCDIGAFEAIYRLFMPEVMKN